MLLSAAVIVRDEEQHLGRCLASLQNLVDEMVVVDTGSVDRSVEIARSFGSRVEHFAWTEDFSAARNYALDLVSGQWVLYIDADEEVQSCDCKAVRDQLNHPEYVGYEVLLRPRPAFTPHWILRLFRSDPAIRFQGIIHENIWPAVQAYREGTLRVGRSSLFLEHVGYEGDLTRKRRRNLPLLKTALQVDPKRIFCWCDLADAHAALGEENLAVDALHRALEIVRSKTTLSPEDSLPYVRLVQRLLDSNGDASALLAEARARFAGNAQLLWLEGRAHIQAGHYDPAILTFEQLLEMGQSRLFDHSSAYDLRIFGVLAYESLATCYFRSRRYQESARYYQLAAAAAPDRLDYRAKQLLCDSLAGRETV